MLKEVLSSFYEGATQCHIHFLLHLFTRVFLGKLWGHEDMFNNGKQNVRVNMRGSRGLHEYRG